MPFEVPADRAPVADFLRGVREGAQNAQQFQMNQIDMDQKRRAQRLQEIQMSFSVLDRLSPDARRAGTRSLLASMAGMGDLPLLQEYISTNPDIAGPSVEEMRQQLGQKYLDTAPPTDQLATGQAILGGGYPPSDSTNDNWRWKQAIETVSNSMTGDRWLKMAMDELGLPKEHPKVVQRAIQFVYEAAGGAAAATPDAAPSAQGSSVEDDTLARQILDDIQQLVATGMSPQEAQQVAIAARTAKNGSNTPAEPGWIGSAASGIGSAITGLGRGIKRGFNDAAAQTEAVRQRPTTGPATPSEDAYERELRGRMPSYMRANNRT